MRPFAVIPVVLSLVACGEQEPSAPAEVAPEVAQAALTAAGPAVTVTPDADANLQWAASVVRVDDLARQGDRTVKLFGVGGGDPAMNGLQTYVAFFQSPADGWAVFPVADVLEYRILSDAPGRVALELTESHMDDASGEIGSRIRRVIVGWAPSAGSPPLSVTVTPAR